jgi:hypothetical protein
MVGLCFCALYHSWSSISDILRRSWVQSMCLRDTEDLFYDRKKKQLSRQLIFDDSVKRLWAIRSMIMMWSGSVPLHYYHYYLLSLWHWTLGISGVNDNGAIPYPPTPMQWCLSEGRYTASTPLHILYTMTTVTGFVWCDRVLVPLCWHWCAGGLRIRIHVFALVLKNQFCDTLSMFRVFFIVIAGH